MTTWKVVEPGITPNVSGGGNDRTAIGFKPTTSEIIQQSAFGLMVEFIFWQGPVDAELDFTYSAYFTNPVALPPWTDSITVERFAILDPSDPSFACLALEWRLLYRANWLAGDQHNDQGWFQQQLTSPDLSSTP